MSVPRPDDDRALERLLRRAGPPPAPDAARAGRVEAALRAALRHERRRRRSRRLLAALGAAAALGAVAVTLWRGDAGAAPAGAAAPAAPIASVAGLTGELRDRRAGERLAAGSPLGVGAEPETLGGALAALRFPGERSLRLDGATRLRLLAPERVELLSGAVYLDSPPNTLAAPLRIVAAGYEIVERGTQFEVRLAGANLLVRVREGAVDLVRGDGRERIAAGWLAERRAGAGAHDADRPVAHDDPAWSWVWRAAPPYPVEGRTFGEFLAWFRRETGRSLRLGAEVEARLATARLHGSIAGLGPDDALATLAAAVGLETRRSGSEWVLEPVEGRR